MADRTVLSSWDKECKAAIQSLASEMVKNKEMRWTRKEFLHSSEAALEIIAMLPLKFRNLDPSAFRRIMDGADKVGADKGGLCRFTDRERPTAETSVIGAINRWDEAREHEHSAGYDTDTPEKAARRSAWKRDNGYQCAACGSFRLGKDLQIHHYTYERFGYENDDDVCCVCNPATTTTKCHALLDLAREIRTGKVCVEESLPMLK